MGVLWSLGPAKSAERWLLTGMGAVYVMIRGFTNCEKDGPEHLGGAYGTVGPTG